MTSPVDPTVGLVRVVTDAGELLLETAMRRSVWDQSLGLPVEEKPNEWVGTLAIRLGRRSIDDPDRLVFEGALEDGRLVQVRHWRALNKFFGRDWNTSISVFDRERREFARMAWSP